MTTSLGRIAPKSPCNASVGCKNTAIMPIELNVATSFCAIHPDFPTPVNTTLPCWCCEDSISDTDSDSASCASGDVAYNLSRCVSASRSVDNTWSAFWTDLLSTLVDFSAAYSSALSGGVAGSVSILSTIGGHAGKDGVNGVSRPLLKVAIVVAPVSRCALLYAESWTTRAFCNLRRREDLRTLFVVRLSECSDTSNVVQAKRIRNNEWINPPGPLVMSEKYKRKHSALRDHDAMDLVGRGSSVEGSREMPAHICKFG